MFDLEGKVALVTGAASGIGFAYTKELLRNKVKAVALIDIDDAKGQQALNIILQEFGNNRAIFVKADVSDKIQLENAFETTVKTFKQLDIVINNAGILHERQWEKCIAINLMGAITGSQMAMEKYLPKYKSGSEGLIINTASAAGIMPFEEGPVYSASKSGIIHFTRAMGGQQRYELSKVKILAICPGFIDTDLVLHNKDPVEEPYLTNYLKLVAVMPHQTPEALVKNVMKVIKEATTGSVWLAIGGPCTQVEFPQYVNAETIKNLMK